MFSTIYRNIAFGAIATFAFNAAAQGAAYSGTPHNGPHSVTSAGATVEAEDFDMGGFDKTYHFKAVKARKESNQANSYRKDKGDADAKFVPVNDGGAGRTVLGNIDGEDWACYTLDVKDAGLYNILVTGSCDGVSKFHLTLDGKPISRDKTIPRGGWGTYNTVEFPSIPLSAGKHVLRWAPVGRQV